MTAAILASLAKLGGLAFVLWLGDRVACRMISDAMHQPTPTRLRIKTERHRARYCESCQSPTSESVVVRLYDSIARVCPECAQWLAPECAA